MKYDLAVTDRKVIDAPVFSKTSQRCLRAGGYLPKTHKWIVMMTALSWCKINAFHINSYLCCMIFWLDMCNFHPRTFTHDPKDILYIEGMQNYLKLHLKDNRTRIIHQTMTSLEELLPKDSFYRIHKSYLINIYKIDSVSGGRLFINGEELPISKPRKEKLLNSVVYKNLISK